MLGSAAVGHVRTAADEHRGPAAVRGLGPDAALAGPDALQLGQLTVECVPAFPEVDARCLVVVFTATHRQAEREPALGETVDRRGLLREQSGVRTQRGDEDVGDEADPLGDRRCRGE